MTLAKLVLAFISSFLIVSGALGQQAGNPENWCRGGSFAFDSDEFKIGTVKGSNAKRVYFYNDLEEDCPVNESCKDKAYVVPGDRVVVARTFKNFACTWYSPVKGLPTVGWIKLENLTLSAGSSKPLMSDWLGEWIYGENSVKLAYTKAKGPLRITGEAYWRGLGDSIHIGELDGRAVPTGNVLKLGEDEPDKYACKAEMRLVSNFLVVRDNMQCGGANVSFSGVYRKKR